MDFIDKTKALQMLCEKTKKWGMRISFDSSIDTFTEIRKAAPYLNFEEKEGIYGEENAIQILAENGGIILFDTKKEMDKAYEQTVGDDGPTKTNPYKGSCRVYALTCNSKGELQNENT